MGNVDSDCLYCAANSFALAHPLRESSGFHVVCDVHPLREGHILIVPKAHIACMGALPDDEFTEFLQLYEAISHFLERAYGAVSTFEHGKIGQTVFHAHVHLLPFAGDAAVIVPERREVLTPFGDLGELRCVYGEDGQYLFFSIGDSRWFVDTSLGAPRFFRDRFASVLGHPERGNWKTMRSNPALMARAAEEIRKLEDRWRHDEMSVHL